MQVCLYLLLIVMVILRVTSMGFIKCDCVYIKCVIHVELYVCFKVTYVGFIVCNNDEITNEYIVYALFRMFW